MGKIRLNDETEYDVRSCGEADNYLVIRVDNGGSVLAMAQVFSDTAKTSKITYIIGSAETVHTGFTALEVVLHHPGTASYTVELRKE